MNFTVRQAELLEQAVETRVKVMAHLIQHPVHSTVLRADTKKRLCEEQEEYMAVLRKLRLTRLRASR